MSKSRSFARAKRPRGSIWKQLNSPRVLARFDNGNFTGTRKKALLLVILAIVSGVFIADQAFKTGEASSNCIPTREELAHSLPCGDPTTILWDETSASFTSDFNYFHAGYATALNGKAGWNMTADATHTSVVLTKTTIDLGVVVGKELLADNLWNYLNGASVVNTCTTHCKEFGWYLSRNGTLPQQTNYSPYTDPSIAMLWRITQPSATQVYNVLYLQRQIDASVSDQTGTCGASIGACFSDTAFATVQSTQYNVAGYVLNFTGTAGTGGASGESYLTTGGVDAICPCANEVFTNVFVFPWFQVSGQPYYLGFYQIYGDATPTSVVFYADIAPPLENMSFGMLVPTPVVIPVSPTIDTGGFFGPIIKALISIGVFILQNVIQFFGYISTAIIAALNSIGSFFSLGPLGTDLSNFFSGIANFFTNIFNPIVGTVTSVLATFASLVTAGLNLTTTYFTNIQAFFTNLAAFLSGFWTVYGTLVKFSASSMFTLWMIFGMFSFITSLEKGMRWFRMTGDGGLLLIRGLQWGFHEGAQTLVWIKQLVAQWV